MKRSPQIVVRRDALRAMCEAFYMVIIQCGPERDDNRDQIIALCPRKCDARKVQYALEEYL
ncbi:MAG TPA: hypothetical protein VJX30_03110 [Terriglobales bacterium]|jgi:hypothetical protein|nr:hypothetical protein [Terriglobales bacterium]